MHKATIKNQSAVMNKGSTVVIQPARNVSGAVRLPGDKSISHRYAMLAALAEGASRFENFSTGGDCASTLRCLGALRSEEHTSELQSLTNLVCRLLLEKKKKLIKTNRNIDQPFANVSCHEVGKHYLLVIRREICYNRDDLMSRMPLISMRHMVVAPL